MNEIDEIDRDALKRALVACRAESPARAKQIDSMLTERPWEGVAQFASCCAQGRALDLMPWQSPPSHANLGALSNPLAIREPPAKAPSCCDAC